MELIYNKDTAIYTLPEHIATTTENVKTAVKKVIAIAINRNKELDFLDKENGIKLSLCPSCKLEEVMEDYGNKLAALTPGSVVKSIENITTQAAQPGLERR